MWLKNGADHLKIPENVEDIKNVIVRRKGMSYPVQRVSSELYRTSVLCCESPDGVPLFFFFDKENHRIMLYPRSDRRYSVMITGLVQKLL